MSFCRSTNGKCASRTIVALGAVALFSMGAPGADQVDVRVRSVDFNRPVTVQGQGAVDLSRVGLPPVVFAPTRSGVPEGPGVCTIVPAANCQLPDQAGHGPDGIIGATSDFISGFHVIEGFRNDNELPVTINEVCWWGFYRDFGLAEDCGIQVGSDDFTITVYLNIPGCPVGAPDLGSAVPIAIGNTALKVLTGFMVGDHEEYEYSAQGLSITIPGKTCYWLGIQNNTPGTPDCVWLWSTADGDLSSYQDGAPDPANDFDLAVCVSEPLGDTSFCTLPPDEACLDATGVCYEANDSPGCDDACCCTTVCAVLPPCCFSPWTEACAAIALDSGCTVLPPLPLCCTDPCDKPGKPVANCQVYTAENAYTSTGDPGPAADLFHTADDFTVAESGEITSLCFQGAYAIAAVPDSFIVKVYDDVDGFPGSVIGMASELGGTLTINSRDDTNLEIIAGIPVWQYTSTIDLGGGAGIAVVAGNCYWLEIVNNIGDVETWFWEWAHLGPTQDNPLGLDEEGFPAPRQGNGRSLQDGVGDGIEEPDGYDFLDTITSHDLAFCINLQLEAEACGFGDKGTDTGPHELVLFNLADSHLGWSSGDLGSGPPIDTHRRTAQAFTLPPIPAGPNLAWSIEQILLEGFDPGNINEFLNFEIFTRTAMDVAPTGDDTVILIEEVPFGGGFDVLLEEFGIIAQDLFMDPGDYWLTFWASNSSGGATVSNIAWFTNARNGINNFCTVNMPPPADAYTGCLPSDPMGEPAGTPAMLRARIYPDPGFGAYTLDPTVLDVSPNAPPGAVAADLYNAAFRLRMRALEPPLPCPWDCQDVADGNVGINDFLKLLGEWAQVGVACDFGAGPPGIGVEDFLELLAHWGLCP